MKKQAAAFFLLSTITILSFQNCSRGFVANQLTGGSSKEKDSTVLISKDLNSPAGAIFAKQSAYSDAAADEDIVDISLDASQNVRVFDSLIHKRERDNLPDSPVNAWKDNLGQVHLLIPHYENYRMSGTSLLNIQNANKIFHSPKAPSEETNNYNTWIVSPYTSDGVNLSSINHHEWYACTMNRNDCGGLNSLGSWVSSITSLQSSDGGASWSNSQVVHRQNFRWTGSQAFNSRIYAKKINHSGFANPSRIIKENDYYYFFAGILERDFDHIVDFEAPISKYGHVLFRTRDLKSNQWEMWNGGSEFRPSSEGVFKAFMPSPADGSPLNTAPPQIIYDSKAKTYILIYAAWGNPNLYFNTTRSLAEPVFTAARVISNSASVRTDNRPNGYTETGFTPNNYPSVIDADSPGFNFEFATGNTWLFYSSSPGDYKHDTYQRDLYRMKLNITHSSTPRADIILNKVNANLLIYGWETINATSTKGLARIKPGTSCQAGSTNWQAWQSPHDGKANVKAEYLVENNVRGCTFEYCITALNAMYPDQSAKTVNSENSSCGEVAF